MYWHEPYTKNMKSYMSWPIFACPSVVKKCVEKSQYKVKTQVMINNQ